MTTTLYAILDHEIDFWGNKSTFRRQKTLVRDISNMIALCPNLQRVNPNSVWFGMMM